MSFSFFRAIVFLLALFLVLPVMAQRSLNGVTAHRGDSFKMPENTLDAFKSGIDSGADWIETDVYKTADGKLVLIHDSNTKRTCGVDRNVLKCNWRDLQDLDAAFDFRKRNKLNLTECPVRRIPLLEEAVDLILFEKKARLSLQPKCDCVDDIIKLIRQKKAVGWIGFNDGNFNYMKRAKELEPTVTVFWDRASLPLEKLAQDAEQASFWKFEYIVPNERDLTREKIDFLKGKGFLVGTWTVNDEKRMTELLKIGVDRIYTDNPSLLLKTKTKLKNK